MTESIAQLVPSKNPYLTILSNHEFTLQLPPDFDVTIIFIENNGSGGYIYSPGIPSPAFLANAIETILNSYPLRMNNYAVYFNGLTNSFGISIQSLRRDYKVDFINEIKSI